MSYQFYGQLFGCRGRDLPNFLYMLIHSKLHNLLQGEAFRFLIKYPMDFIPDLVPVPTTKNERSDQEAAHQSLLKGISIIPWGQGPCSAEYLPM